MAGKLPLVIVGASYAGTRLAATARDLGYDAPIILLGEESHRPYQRPPLSKGLLAGSVAPDELALWGEGFYANHAIDLRSGVRATGIDPRAREVRLDDGSSLRYATLALTTGARCRTLAIPGAGLDGVFALRSLDDALRLHAALADATRVCVIGGGFIGLEVAASARRRGLAVEVVESAPRLLARAVSPRLSSYLERAHRLRGVEVRLGRQVRALRADAGRVVAAELDDGGSIACDVVVVGVGALPNVELAEQAGIATRNGIVVDGFGRTSAPGVLAAGDVASLAHVDGAGDASPPLRLESIHAANEGARAAASGLCGQMRAFGGVPWFWSDQYELKLQMAGLTRAGDTAVLRGDPEADRFSEFHLRDGRVVAAHSVNRPGEHMLARRWIEAGARIDARMLADTSVDLKGWQPTP